MKQAGHLTRFTSRFLCTLTLAAMSAAASAGSDDVRTYVSPMAGYFFADDERRADDGGGGALAFGIEASELFNVELELAGDSLDKDTAAGGVENFKQFSAAVNGLLVLARESLFSPYLLAGAGILNTNGSTDESASAMGQVGLGTFVNVSDNLALRVDGRYRMDANDGKFYSAPRFDDYVVMLGLAWKFGGVEAAPVAAVAAPVVAAAAVVAAAPVDSDGDGVTDDLDKCPETPAGTKVDAQGCPLEKDSDGDGVSDDKDLCPDTAAGAKVNATGCPDKQAVVLKGVNFETNSDKLTPDSKSILDKVAATLRDNPDIKVSIDGHTDNRGSAALNKALSLSRANSVKRNLISNGVDGGRMSTRGFGPDQPIADNKTAAGRAANRRVELSILE